MRIMTFRTALCVAPVLVVVVLCVASAICAADDPEQAAEPSEPPTVRVAAVQAKRRLIDWRMQDPALVLAAVDKTLVVLEEIVHKAGGQKCDVLAFPEDTLGLLNWLRHERAGREPGCAQSRVADARPVGSRGRFASHVPCPVQ